jgi:Ni/Co efflux regulator RcnB
MQTRWWVTVCATGLVAMTCVAGVAQDGHDHDNDRNHGQSQRDENRGQTKKRYRQFNENQRQYATTYYNQNRGQEVFRNDERWNNDYDSRLHSGYVLDDDMRRMSRPAPYEMTRGMGRPPRGYRYVVIGGHVVLIDGGYRVHDAIHFEINLGH